MLDFLASATDEISKKLMDRMGVIERLILLGNVKLEKERSRSPHPHPRGGSNKASRGLAAEEEEKGQERSRSPRRQHQGPN